MDDFKELLATILPAAIGSGLSVYDAKHQISNKVYAVFEFLFGLAVAIYGGHAISSWLDIPVGEAKSLAISFTMGYIGLTILREFKTKISNVINKLIGKYFKE